jgi:putative lipase involved disintegration of autophagic bodies
MFGCCSSRRTRFRSLADPVLKELHKRKEFLTSEGRKYSTLSVAKKKEAAEHFRDKDEFMAEAKAIEAIRNDQIASSYMKILKIIDSKIKAVQQLWSDHDLIDNVTSTADHLQSLGLIQKDEMTGTEQFPSIDDRIKAANKTEQDFKVLIADMNDEIKKVSMTGVEEIGDVFSQIQRWSLGELQSPRQMKEMTPAELEMVA